MEPTGGEPPDSTRWTAGCCSRVLQNRRTTSQAGRTRPCLEKRDVYWLKMSLLRIYRGDISQILMVFTKNVIIIKSKKKGLGLFYVSGNISGVSEDSY